MDPLLVVALVGWLAAGYFLGRWHEGRSSMGSVGQKLDAILSTVNTQGGHVMASFADLAAQVAQNASTEASALAVIQDLVSRIEGLLANGGDPAAIQALVDELKASQDALAAGIAAVPPANP